MMKKSFLVWLIIFLIGSAVVATESDTLTIKLESSDPGNTLRASDVNWPKNIDEQIKLVNAGRGEFFVEIYNDPTVWQVVNWLKKQPGTAILDSSQMNLTFDGGLNTARYQNTVRLFREKGLRRLTFRYIPDRGQQSMIKVYFVGQNKEPVETKPADSKAKLICSGHSNIVPSKPIEVKWNLGFGGEWTAVSGGRPILVPALSLTRSKSHSELGLTGAYRPTGKNDYKFFAGSAAYFPHGNKLGLLVRVIYASEAIETYGAYVQQGFGPTAGIVWRKQALSLYLTGGVQYFDRRGQDRRAEATVNAGLNLKAISL